MPNPTVVVIEDEPQIRRFVRMALEGEGWQVHEADTGKKGLVEAGTRQPDLLVVDLGLPDLDGLDVVRDVRGWSTVPIIVLSARVGEADKIAALDAGADDYLTKPFGVGELLARMRANLRRPRTAVGDFAVCGASGGVAEGANNGTAGVHLDVNPLFTFGEVEVDRLARIVRRNGAEVHLTPLEYRLLGVLFEGQTLIDSFHRRLLMTAGGSAKTRFHNTCCQSGENHGSHG